MCSDIRHLVHRMNTTSAYVYSSVFSSSFEYEEYNCQLGFARVHLSTPNIIINHSFFATFIICTTSIYQTSPWESSRSCAHYCLFISFLIGARSHQSAITICRCRRHRYIHSRIASEHYIAYYFLSLNFLTILVRIDKRRRKKLPYAQMTLGKKQKIANGFSKSKRRQDKCAHTHTHQKLKCVERLASPTA